MNGAGAVPAVSPAASLRHAPQATSLPCPPRLPPVVTGADGRPYSQTDGEWFPCSATPDPLRALGVAVMARARADLEWLRQRGAVSPRGVHVDRSRLRVNWRHGRSALYEDLMTPSEAETLAEWLAPHGEIEIWADAAGLDPDSVRRRLAVVE